MARAPGSARSRIERLAARHSTIFRNRARGRTVTRPDCKAGVVTAESRQHAALFALIPEPFDDRAFAPGEGVQSHVGLQRIVLGVPPMLGYHQQRPFGPTRSTASEEVRFDREGVVRSGVVMALPSPIDAGDLPMIGFGRRRRRAIDHLPKVPKRLVTQTLHRNVGAGAKPIAQTPHRQRFIAPRRAPCSSGPLPIHVHITESDGSYRARVAYRFCCAPAEGTAG